MKALEKAKHPINCGTMMKLSGIAIVVLLLGWLMTFAYYTNLPPTVVTKEIYDTVLVYDTMTVHDTVVVHDTVNIKCKPKVIVKEKIVPVEVIKEKIVTKIDTVCVPEYIEKCCKKPTKYFYYLKFHQHRYPQHGPLWERDSIKEK